MRPLRRGVRGGAAESLQLFPQPLTERKASIPIIRVQQRESKVTTTSIWQQVERERREARDRVRDLAQELHAMAEALNDLALRWEPGRDVDELMTDIARNLDVRASLLHGPIMVWPDSAWRALQQANATYEEFRNQRGEEER